MKKYKCMNIGNCDYANTGKEFDISEGDDLKCPNCKCGSDMIVEVRSTKWKLIGIVAGVIVGVLAVATIICCFTGVIPCPWGGKKPERIILKEKSFTLFENQSALIEASLEPEGAKGTLTYKSSDPKSVSITNGGKITALKKTSENVIITVKLEEYPDVRESCKVIVVKKTPPPTILVESLSIKESDFVLSIGNSKQLNITVLPENHDEEISIVSSMVTEKSQNSITIRIVTITRGILRYTEDSLKAQTRCMNPLQTSCLIKGVMKSSRTNISSWMKVKSARRLLRT